MRKLYILLIILSFTVTVNAQKKDKIKGNKIVTDVYKDLEDFNAIEISDNLTVNITQALNNGYHLMADENLINVINFEVIDSVLKIYTTSKITSSKKLEINLAIKQFNKVTLRNNAKLISKNKLVFINLDFEAFDNTSYELDLKVENSYFKVHKSSSGKILLNGKNATMVFDENAFLKGEISLESLELTTNDRSDLSLSGDVNSLKVKAAGSSSVKAKDLKASYTVTNTENSSNIYVYATKELSIYAKDKSSIYVYGQPEIKVDGLNDKSQIVKK